MNNRHRLAKRLMTKKELYSYEISKGLITLLNASKNFGKLITDTWKPKPKNIAYAFRKKRSK